MICPAIAIHWGLHEEIMPGVGTVKPDETAGKSSGLLA